MGIDRSPAAEAPPFALERWDKTAEVSLSDFAGKIVVLDFFAYWCVPCLRASADLEVKVRRHYSERGNRAGVPVEVVSINVEAGQRARTEAFIQRAGLHLVVNDRNGKTLEAYGGRNLPFIVVIEGTQATAEKPTFRIAYRREGFEGADKIRTVIDGIGSRNEARHGEPRQWSPSERGGGVFGSKSHASVRTASTTEVPEGAGKEPGVDADWVRSQLRQLVWSGRFPLYASTVSGVSSGPGSGIDSKIEEERSEEGLPVEDGRAGLPLTYRPSLSVEGLYSGDVQLSQGTLAAALGRGAWEANVSAGVSTIGLDYRPVSFDFLGMAQRVEEFRAFVQGGGKWRVHPRVTLLGGAGFYDGFTDYRSAWLSEYYRQEFSSLDEYVAPSPSGHNLSGGVRWEYLPGSGFLQLDYGYLADEIAPGYEIDFDGLRRGRPYLYTHLVKVSLENVLTRWLRVLHEFRRVDTSDRDPRFGYQGSANVALGERWVVRLQGGLAREEPTFHAFYGGAMVEYELGPNWWLQGGGRYYEDTGEIENSNFSNAAPPLQAWHAGIGIRHNGERHAFRLFAAPYSTRYGEFGIGTAFFEGLYRNRDWGLVQASLEFNF